MEDNKGLMVVEKVELVPFFTKGESVDDIITAIEKEARSFVADVTTAKGRDAVKKMVTKVTKSKTYLEKNGKELAAEYKAIPKAIDENRRKVKEALTLLAEEVRKPLTEYEEEAQRLAVEKQQAEAAEKLAAEVDEAQELALLMNDKFDANKKEADRLAKELAEKESQRLEAERIEREKRIAEEATERERLASIEREEAAKRQVEEAERAKIAAEERAKLEAEQAEQRRLQAENQAKIDADNAAEQARLAEVARQEAEAKRIADEQAKREANKKHIGRIRKEAKETLMNFVDEETAKKIVLAINNGEITNVTINY